MLMPAFLLLVVALSQTGTNHMQKLKLNVEQSFGGLGVEMSTFGLAPRGAGWWDVDPPMLQCLQQNLLTGILLVVPVSVAQSPWKWAAFSGLLSFGILLLWISLPINTDISPHSCKESSAVQWLQKFKNFASGKLENVYFQLVWFFVFVCFFFNVWSCWGLNPWISLGCFHAHVTSTFS